MCTDTAADQTISVVLAAVDCVMATKLSTNETDFFFFCTASVYTQCVKYPSVLGVRAGIQSSLLLIFIKIEYIYITPSILL